MLSLVPGIVVVEDLHLMGRDLAEFLASVSPNTFMEDHDYRFARILVLGKATAGDHADHDQTEPFDRLPNCRPLTCAYRTGGQSTTLWDE
jgi:hypothetical protein